MDILTAIDQRVLEALYEIRTLPTTYFFILVSEFGRAATIVGFAAITALLLIVRKHYAYATGLFVSVASAGMSILLLKGVIERARPDEMYQAYIETWYSFPSAHVAFAAALYGFLMALAWRTFSSRIARYAAFAGGCILISGVTFSRLYLGVHFLSDVIAGLVLGIACMWLGLFVAKKVRV